MLSDLWRWADPNGQQRKVRLDELRASLAAGLIAPNAPVWRAGWHAWQPAHEVPELTSASVGGANGVVLNIPPPPLAMLAVQQEYEKSGESLAPAPVSVKPFDPNEEPPPPPTYVPLPVKQPSVAPPPAPSLRTQIGGSARADSARPPPRRGAEPGHRLGPSLPTAIGLPPPPELLQGEGAPPSTLRDRAAPAAHSAANGVVGDGSGAPTDPVINEAHPSDDTIAEEDIPGMRHRRPGLTLIFEDIAEIRQGRPPKNKLLFAVIGVLGLSFVIMLVAGVVSLVSGPAKPTKTAPTASSSIAARPAAPPSIELGGAIPPPVPPPAAAASTAAPAADCSAIGDAKTIAPRAVITSGIEVAPVGTGLALGFATGPREAIATSLDPVSLAPTATVRTKSFGGDARRVTPILLGGKLVAVPDVDRKGDRLGSRRLVPATPLLDIGNTDGAIGWALHGRDNVGKLFTLDTDPTPVEALRAIALSDRKGIAFTFRRGNAIHVGVAKGDSALEADGELVKIPGLGQVGSPAIAASGEQVIVAWADRAGAQDEWKVRWTRLKPGATAEDPTSFAIPEGGLGGQAMSPSVASLGGGRFLLAWTEGPVSNHQVRAMTIGADGAPSGSPIAVSPSGVNAGQPAAIVTPDGHGAVAFLAAKGKALEVHATPISCQR